MLDVINGMTEIMPLKRCDDTSYSNDTIFVVI